MVVLPRTLPHYTKPAAPPRQPDRAIGAASSPRPYTDQFTSPQEFAGYRNRLGGLVLLPRGFNQSLGADDYPTKTVAYFGQNLLAKTLTEPCYRNNPSFLAFREQTELPFRPYAVFDKQALDERQDLYRGLAALLWSADRIRVN